MIYLFFALTIQFASYLYFIVSFRLQGLQNYLVLGLAFCLVVAGALLTGFSTVQQNSPQGINKRKRIMFSAFLSFLKWHQSICGCLHDFMLESILMNHYRPLSMMPSIICFPLTALTLSSKTMRNSVKCFQLQFFQEGLFSTLILCDTDHFIHTKSVNKRLVRFLNKCFF